MIMKLYNHAHISKREQKFNKVGQLHGLIILALFGGGVLLQISGKALGSALIVLGTIALITSFISGYRRSDEFQKKHTAESSCH